MWVHPPIHLQLADRNAVVGTRLWLITTRARKGTDCPPTAVDCLHRTGWTLTCRPACRPTGDMASPTEDIHHRTAEVTPPMPEVIPPIADLHIHRSSRCPRALAGRP